MSGQTSGKSLEVIGWTSDGRPIHPIYGTDHSILEIVFHDRVFRTVSEDTEAELAVKKEEEGAPQPKEDAL